ncbi:hypothetical protein, partial [Staphylococcus aureus]
MVQKSEVAGRLLRIVETGLDRRLPARRVVAIAAILALTIGVGTAGIRLQESNSNVLNSNLADELTPAKPVT